MFLHTKLESRKDHIKIAFIGCGKFVSMFLAQYSHLNKIQIDSIKYKEIFFTYLLLKYFLVQIMKFDKIRICRFIKNNII